MTFQEWESTAKEMDSPQRRTMITALVTLDRWPEFKREYGWTGYDTLIYILKLAEQKSNTSETMNGKPSNPL
jgi:hypothetical protein